MKLGMGMNKNSGLNAYLDGKTSEQAPLMRCNKDYIEVFAFCDQSDTKRSYSEAVRVSEGAPNDNRN